MSLTSWSEPSMIRNLRQLDPFQRTRVGFGCSGQIALASAARAIRLYSMIESSLAEVAK